MTFTHRSTMSSNLNTILYDLNMESHELDNISIKDVKELYFNKWLNNVNNDYVTHTKVIKELIMMKEGIFYGDLDISQCDFIINLLCTL